MEDCSRKIFHAMRITDRNSFAFLLVLVMWLASCSTQKKIGKLAKVNIINTPALHNGHIGITLYDPISAKYLYNYQGDKFFVPASNTKIPTCYAAMKWLGDSLVAFRVMENDTAVFILPSGDPTLLHEDFKRQPGFEFLRSTRKNIYVVDKGWREKALGDGWSWDDYNDDYLVERNPLPVYGNVIKWIGILAKDGLDETLVPSVFSEPAVNWPLNFALENKDSVFFVQRERDRNEFAVYEGKQTYKEQVVPFVTNGLSSVLELLPDTLGKRVEIRGMTPASTGSVRVIHSQPTDSMLRPMMHRSDNFFAEQTLLMVSNERLGFMSDRAIIDSLLKTDLRDLPQAPHWVDGSGLSRYNLFTPQDMVAILDKMEREFGMERLKIIFPTGGEGTLSKYYLSEKGTIYAKTGSMTAVVAISGYLYTRKGKRLIFSVLVNNNQGSATDVRRAVEGFLRSIIAAN